MTTMGGLCKVLLILFWLTKFSNGSYLLRDFLKSKSIRHAAIVDCGSASANKGLYKSVIHLGISAAVYNFETCCGNLDDSVTTAIYLNADCENWSKLIKSREQFFSSTYHWLIKTSNYSAMITELFSVPLRIDSEVTVAVQASENHFELYDAYNSGFYNSGRFNSTRVGFWTANTGVVNLSSQWKYMRRANMTGVVLKCVIVVTKKLAGEKFEDYIERPELTHIDSMNRFNYALLLHLKDIYNFRYNMLRTNSWGYIRNGTVDGMVGFLQRKQADIGGSPIFFRLERAKLVDFTAQTWISRPCFIFRHPKQVGSFYNIYTRPLDDKVWYCTVALVTSAAVALRSLITDSKRKNPENNIDTSWSYTILAMLSAVCQQGLSLERSTTTIRLTVFTVFLFALTMYQFYSASITSSLLLEPPRSIRTLQELLDSPMRAGIEDILYNVDYFSRTTDPVALELYRKKIVTPRGKNYFTAADGLAMVKRGGFAFHVDIATAYKIIRETFAEQEICELVEIQLFPPQRMVAIVQKGSPYRKLVTYGLRKIAESGLMHHQKKVWHEPKPKCIRTPDASVFSVNLYEFSMALLIFSTGALLSLVILTFEVIVHALQVRGRNGIFVKSHKNIGRQ